MFITLETIFQMSSRSMSRFEKRRESESDEKSFYEQVDYLIKAITSPEQFIAWMRLLSESKSGIRNAGLLLLFTNQLWTRFIHRNLNGLIDGKPASMVGALLSMRDKCQWFVPDLTKKLELCEDNAPYRWVLEMTRKASQDFLVLFHELMMRADNNDPRVVEYQKRVIQEKVEAFHKSPYYLELGATISNPARFASGWFETHGLLDDDGFLE
jgi:hypothetical protein